MGYSLSSSPNHFLWYFFTLIVSKLCFEDFRRSRTQIKDCDKITNACYIVELEFTIDTTTKMVNGKNLDSSLRSGIKLLEGLWLFGLFWNKLMLYNCVLKDASILFKTTWIFHCNIYENRKSFRGKHLLWSDNYNVFQAKKYLYT